MQRPTLLEGVLVALVLSLLAAPLVALLHSLVGSLLAWKAVVVAMTYTYICYLLVQRGRTSGRVTLGLLALAVLLAGVALDLRSTSLLLLCVGLIWGTRSLAYSRSLVSAVLQGVVCARRRCCAHGVRAQRQLGIGHLEFFPGTGSLCLDPASAHATVRHKHV
jgi:signal transduction histidine kinase